jgi:hypothetical protein
MMMSSSLRMQPSLGLVLALLLARDAAARGTGTGSPAGPGPNKLAVRRRRRRPPLLTAACAAAEQPTNGHVSTRSTGPRSARHRWDVSAHGHEPFS